MARVQLELPEKFFYSTTMQVRFTDVNPSGHVGNDQMISLLSSARYSFFQYLGLEDTNDVGGCTLVVTDLVTSYRAESFAEETLRFELGLTDFNKYGADVIFRVTKDINTLVTLAKTGFVFLDSNKKVCPVPEAFLKLLPKDMRPWPLGQTPT
ncbi:thioesterase [Pseudomaricurvus alkylphenolicus]|jgi:acyl-CoA thioesterase FadM|uniref:thioesterase family protein n=1 Tax=Pseudomaricurvus alkylphenolicus TaxID=1306991 RepID=UPI00141F5E2C|nr:thioesterase family protein [Pseudomaricurvus alkylphenolicus]NIB41940.1 thioesterase [Pseudomaricurvus alkylphenolicus]